MTNYSPAAAATFMVAIPILMNLLIFSGQISSYQKEVWIRGVAHQNPRINLILC
jgi:hypothetical protein